LKSGPRKKWIKKSPGGTNGHGTSQPKELPVALATFVKLQLLVGAVSINPNLNAGPGGATFEKLVDWLAGIMLLVCAVGALFGIGKWVLGSRDGHPGQVQSGRNMVGIAMLGAFVIGALPAFINFLNSLGTTVHK
jgi:hypothetical protein